MADRHWFNPRDAAVRAAYDALERELGPLLGHVFPDFKLTHFGIHRRPDDLRFIDGRDEIQITLHLRPLGEAYEIDTRLRATALPDLLPRR